MIVRSSIKTRIFGGNMQVLSTKLEGVVIIEPMVFGDHRGWFMESYSYDGLKKNGIDTEFIQDNHSYSSKAKTLRGIHFQNNPQAQSKLVRCTKGKIMDFVVDLRLGSPCYKEWISIELSEENKRMIFIPQGFGHAFLTLENDTEVQYKVDKYYSPIHDRSINYKDIEISIDWGVSDPIVSDKDFSAPLLKDSDCNFRYKNVR